MQRSLRHNVSWTFLGNAVYAGCQWAMLVVLAKLGTPEMVGQFTLGLAIAAPVFMLTNLQLRTAQATDASHRYCFRDYFGLRLASIAVALFLITTIAIAVGYRWEIVMVVLILSLAKGVEAISDLFYGLIQQYEQMDRIAISMMMKGVLSLLFLVFGISFTQSIIGGAIGLVLAWAIVLVIYDWRSGLLMLDQRSALQPRWQLKTLRKLAWLCLPLGFAMMLISLNTNVPRYFIEYYLSERELGIFAAISYLMTAGTTVIGAMGESASPRLAKYYAAQNRVAFGRLLLKLLAIALVLGVAAIALALVAGKAVLTLLYQPEYAQYADLLVWIMVAALMSYLASCLGYGMTAARYFRVQVPLFLTTTVAAALGCVWWVPSQGLRGAAIALIMATTIQALISLGVVIHALNRIAKTHHETEA